MKDPGNEGVEDGELKVQQVGLAVRGLCGVVALCIAGSSIWLMARRKAEEA